MKDHKIAAALMVLFGLALLTTSLHAQSTFVYTNNGTINAPNSVSAFSVGPDGALTPVAGSPFLTGSALGGGLGFVATSRIAVTTLPGNVLYASNDLSNSISGFSIDAITGALTPVPGSPFATGVVSPEGHSLAVTPDGQFLYAGNVAFAPSNTISAFSIASNGALMPIPGSPFPGSPPPSFFPLGYPNFYMKVTPDRKFLAVAQREAGLAMFSIGSNGAVTTVSGSPFFVSSVFPEGPEGLDVNCASSLLFAPTRTFGQGGVNVLNIASNGALTPIVGSPFTFSGSVSWGDVLSPDDQRLFVSNLNTGSITSLNVASGGSLTEVSGSPFPTGTGSPVTMATNQAGTLLYGGGLGLGPFFGSIIIGFNIDSNAALSPVPGSPFSTGTFFSLPSVAVFPPKSCSPAPTITSISPTSAIAGGTGLTLTVIGTNFVSGSTVKFNGNARTTTFVSATQLTAASLASDIATAGSFSVTVTNPSGGTSNAVSFTVVTPQDATQAIINSVNALFAQAVLNGGQDNSLVRHLQHAIDLLNAGNNAGAIVKLDSFISEVNDLLSSGVLSPSQAAPLVSAAESVIARLS